MNCPYKLGERVKLRRPVIVIFPEGKDAVFGEECREDGTYTILLSVSVNVDAIQSLRGSDVA